MRLSKASAFGKSCSSVVMNQEKRSAFQMRRSASSEYLSSRSVRPSLYTFTRMRYR
ncbi:hypothetical protein D3C78_1988720 [compost metagenome]